MTKNFESTEFHDPGYGEVVTMFRAVADHLGILTDAVSGFLNRQEGRKERRKYVKVSAVLDGGGAGTFNAGEPREGYEWYIERFLAQVGAAGTCIVYIGGVQIENAVDVIVAPASGNATPNNSAPYYVRDSQRVDVVVTGGLAAKVAQLTLQVWERPLQV